MTAVDHDPEITSPSIEQAASVLTEARSAVALTGAGMSTESGLPDFRSPGGLWGEYDPLEVATLSAFHRTPEKFFEFYRRRLTLLAVATPNGGHQALAQLEAAGRLSAIITQNVDGLHQAAGSRRVIELHGNLREAACPQCPWTGPIRLIADALAAKTLPVCPRCGGRVKPNVVLFEELLPQTAYRDAEEACRDAGALLVVGSSLQVTPAASLPVIAHRGGAVVIIVNDEPTPLDHLARIILRGRAGTILPALVASVLWA
jgi:NAD-dependent deacetylase